MVKKDLIKLTHMLEAAQTCLEFSKNRKRGDLEKDKLLSFAVVRALEIFGEAASTISKDFQLKHPKIQWRAIIGMRNRLIHAYFDIDFDIVWEALTKEIPSIIPHIQHLLEDLEVEK